MESAVKQLGGGIQREFLAMWCDINLLDAFGGKEILARALKFYCLLCCYLLLLLYYLAAVIVARLFFAKTVIEIVR
jgi:hypothetical protein